MENIASEFVKKYSKLYNKCKDNNYEIRELEDSLKTHDKNCLFVARQLRNFIAHVEDFDKYISIKPEMLDFLDNMYDLYALKDDTVAKHVIKLNTIACTPDNKVSDVINNLISVKRYRCIVVYKNDILGTVSLFDLLKRTKKSEKIKNIKYKNEYITIPSDVLFKDILDKYGTDIYNKTIICVDRITKKPIGFLEGCDNPKMFTL